MRPNDRYVHGAELRALRRRPRRYGRAGTRRARHLGWRGAFRSPAVRAEAVSADPVIWTSPSYAWALGEKAKEEGVRPREDFSIHTIIVAGEPGGSISSTREAIEDLWGAKVVDFFGLSDIYGACAAMCEAKDGLHIVEDQILVETVDPTTGEVLEPGSDR